MKQFVVPMMTLLMLEAVWQQVAVAMTFDQAFLNWQNHSCIFPDKSLYKPADVLPKLEQCRILELTAKTDSPNDKFRMDLCQAFYIMSISVCTREDLQPFARACLNPEILKNANPFVRQDVCSYMFEGENHLKYFNFAQSLDLCSRNCGTTMSSMKDICELYAFIIYQFQHQSTCNPSVTKQPQKEEEKTVKKSNQDKNNTEFLTTEPVTTPRTPDQTQNTSKTQLRLVNTSVEVFKLPETVNRNESLNSAGNNSQSASAMTKIGHPVESSAPIKNESKVPLPGQDDLKTVSSIGEAKTSVASKEQLKTSAPSKEQLKTSAPSKEQLKTSAPSKEESETSVPSVWAPKAPVSGQDDSKTSVSNMGKARVSLSSMGESKTPVIGKEELKTTEPLLISKITAAATQGTVPTETAVLQNKEATTSASKQNTTPEAEEDEKNESDSKDDEQPKDGNGQDYDEDENSVDIGTKKTQSGSEGKLPGVSGTDVSGTGRKKQPDLKKNAGVAVGVDYDDTETSPGSGHFLAYFLTAVVICISGYVIYHNKQKILAFIIEGRNGGRSGRQRSKDVKYSQLKSSVEEVMPSLEQTATGKNFVY